MFGYARRAAVVAATGGEEEERNCCVYADCEWSASEKMKQIKWIRNARN